MALVYSVDCSVFHGLEEGYISVYASCNPLNVKKVIGETKKAIDDLSNGRITSDELNRVKNYLIGSYEIELQKNSAQALTMALNELYGLPVGFDDYIKGIEMTSLESVKAAARKYLNDKRHATVILSPN